MKKTTPIIQLECANSNYFGEFELDYFHDALIEYLLNEIERVYWNKNQKEWNRIDNPKIKGISYRPYYWGDSEKEQELPNLKIGKQEIRWYKHPGRSQTCSIEFSPEEWKNWFDEAIELIQKNDRNY